MGAAGKRNRQITIQQKAVTRDELGGEVVAWVNVAANIWAQVAPGRGDEYYASRQLHAENATTFTILYRPGITEEMRVLYAGKAYNIEDVIDVRDAHIDIELKCRQGLTNG